MIISALLFGRVLLVGLVTLSLISSVAQNPKIDSLKTLLPKSSSDSSKVRILISLASEFRRIGDSQSLTYGTEAYDLAARIDFHKGKASAALQLGRYMRMTARFDESLAYFNEAMGTYKEMDDQQNIAACLNNIGGVYFEQSRYDDAIKYFNESLTIFEKLDIKSEIAKLTGNLGICYEYKGDYTRALESYFEALRMDELTSNKEGMASDFGYIAVVYKKQGDLNKAIEYHQKALDIHLSMNDAFGAAVEYVNMGPAYKDLGNYSKAMEVLNKALQGFSDLKSPRGKAIALHNIGSVYFKQKKFSDAATYFKKALATRDTDDQSGRMSDLTHLADAYLNSGKTDSALVISKRALAMPERFASREVIMGLNKILYEVFKRRNDFKNALLYHEKYLTAKDSLLDEQKTAQLSELQTKYETEKKEQEIAMLNSEKALQDVKLNNRTLLLSASIVVIVFGVVFSIIIIRSNKKRLRSEQQLLNEQLKIKKMEAERLQELDEIKSRFFANIAHEFKTPLTLISGPVENLLEESQDKYSKDQLLLVKRNGARLLSLINQLLDLSKLESGVTKLELHKDDVIAFLKGLTFSFQSLADEKDITLECHTAVQNLRMDFDKDKMEKIMFNLLSNAFKFTPNLGTVKVSVEPVTIDKTDFLNIDIEDSGVGIPESQMPFIFDRFYQADNTQIRNSDGSGIGLALTKELVELHGGTISVKSEHGAGTVFSVLLPMCDNISVQISSPDQQMKIQNGIELLKDPGKLTQNNGEEKLEVVLVIEDNHEVRDFVINSVNKNYHVIAAANGDEGLAMATAEIPDLIISDVMMPGKSGYETCRMLKADERTSHIPVILLTAKAGFENKMEGLETGADDFIAKPFSTRELLVRIKNLITTRKKLREKFLDTVLTEEKPIAATIEDAFLKKIREAVEAHLDDAEFSIEDLSMEIGMSRTQVHRKLKALTNQSASQFMRTIRLKHAKALLQHGGLNVSEVAYKVGFSSPTYFSTCYAGEYGHAPSEERTIAG